MNNTQDIRFQQLQQWLQNFVTDKNYSLVPASSDASFRRYFRLTQNDSSQIIMDSPPEHEDNHAFIKVATLLEQYGLNVPHIYQQDTHSGFLILSDLGSTPYLSQLSATTADALYKKAIDSLIKLQKIPGNHQQLPTYDSALLYREMRLFDEWFLQKHLQLTPPDWLASIYDFLVNNALTQPQVIVHRDFHSRNLMFRMPSLELLATTWPPCFVMFIFTGLRLSKKSGCLTTLSRHSSMICYLLNKHYFSRAGLI